MRFRVGLLKRENTAVMCLSSKYIDGREITVGIVGDEALPVIEIIPESGFYDYEHKYTKGKTQYVCPAEIDEDIAEFVKGLSITAHNVLGCSGFSRVDFRLTDEGATIFSGNKYSSGIYGNFVSTESGKANWNRIS
jgi:D-alanine-D-alanine ligase-like ATP-grasp enzyme